MNYITFPELSMAVKLPPLCPSRQGSGARGCELTAPSLATIHLPLLKKTISMAHSSEYFWSVFIDLELQVQLNWFSPSQPCRAWLHLLSDLKATGRLLLLSGWTSPAPPASPHEAAPCPSPKLLHWTHSVHCRPQLDSGAHQWRMHILQWCCFSFSPSIGTPG